MAALQLVLPMHGGATGPWLVSMAMFSNCMQFVGEDGVPVRELEKLARTKTNLNGMQRWGYIMVTPDEFFAGGKPKFLRFPPIMGAVVPVYNLPDSGTKDLRFTPEILAGVAPI